MVHVYMKDHYGFKTRRSPPQIEEMRDFEGDLIKLIKNIKFRKVNDPFRNKLRKDIKSMRDSNDIIVKADKTRSMFCPFPSNITAPPGPLCVEHSNLDVGKSTSCYMCMYVCMYVCMYCTETCEVGP